MPEIRLTRCYRFSAAHRLHSPFLSGIENRVVYGKCNNPNGHGHNYVLEVAVRGEFEPEIGRFVSVARLDDLVESAVVSAMDRRNLNADVEEFATLVPTTENLAAVVAERLQHAWNKELADVDGRLDSVRIHETGRNIFEVRMRTRGEAAPEAVGAPLKVTIS